VSVQVLRRLPFFDIACSAEAAGERLDARAFTRPRACYNQETADGGGPAMSLSATIKNEAHALVDQLPADATWDDLIYRIYVRQAIEAGLRDADAGRVDSVADVRRSFELPQ
jgi:hypothetical protein